MLLPVIRLLWFLRVIWPYFSLRRHGNAQGLMLYGAWVPDARNCNSGYLTINVWIDSASKTFYVQINFDQRPKRSLIEFKKLFYCCVQKMLGKWFILCFVSLVMVSPCNIQQNSDIMCSFYLLRYLGFIFFIVFMETFSVFFKNSWRYLRNNPDENASYAVSDSYYSPISRNSPLRFSSSWGPFKF